MASIFSSQVAARVCCPMFSAGFLAALFLTVPSNRAIAGQPALIANDFIYQPGTEPYRECHASTLVEVTGPGVHLAAAWFGGTEEKHPDVEIRFSRYDGTVWSKPKSVASGIPPEGGVRYPTWNPVLFQEPGGPLHLFYKVGPSPDSWWGMHKKSVDGGETWDAGVRLPDGVLGPIKNKGLLLSSGQLLCGSSTEAGGWTSHFETFDPTANTWRRFPDLPVVDGLATIQPTLLDHGQGTIQAMFRVRRGGPIAESWSRDNGETWSPLAKSSLQHPGSGIDGVRLPNGGFALVYNDSLTERSPLNVAVSGDGRSWRNALTLESQPGEYSYPACIVGSDGLLHVTYTWKRESIKHAKIDPAKWSWQE